MFAQRPGGRDRRLGYGLRPAHRVLPLPLVSVLSKPQQHRTPLTLHHSSPAPEMCTLRSSTTVSSGRNGVTGRGHHLAMRVPWAGAVKVTVHLLTACCGLPTCQMRQWAAVADGCQQEEPEGCGEVSVHLPTRGACATPAVAWHWFHAHVHAAAASRQEVPVCALMF